MAYMNTRSKTATDRRIYELHAGICQTLANPKRLEIIDRLRGGERSVGELAEALDVSHPNLSQHLAVMRQRGILVRKRSGANVFYALSNPKITKACELMREVLHEHMRSEASLLDRSHRAGSGGSR